jgi:hypothetical protein
MIETESCPVCKRNVYSHDMTNHHWKPSSMGGTDKETMRMCTTCHAMLHEVIPLREVINYKSPESLQENWLFKQYLDFIWTKNHPHSYKVKKLLKSIFTPFVVKNYINRIKASNPRKQVAVSSLP